MCGFNQKIEQNTVDNEEEGSEKSLIDLLNNETEIRGLKASSSMNFQDLSLK
jgi:hypothetical protein